MIAKELDSITHKIQHSANDMIDELNVNENIYILHNDAEQMTSILRNSSSLSSRINLQIQELDVARVCR